MRPTLFDIRMADGSRHFADVPAVPPLVIKAKLASAEGVRITHFIDTGAETWIDFDYCGHSFSIHNPLNDFWLFVRDPPCPDDALIDILTLVGTS